MFYYMSADSICLLLRKTGGKSDKSQLNCKCHWIGPLLKKFKLQHTFRKFQCPEKQPFYYINQTM